MAVSPYRQLEQEFRRLHAFRGALALLRWDAAVMMPRGCADVRGEQLAALETECHALLITPKVARLLDRAQANEQGLDDWQRANLREMRRQRDHAIAIPATLVGRLARTTALAGVKWLEARQQGRFEILAPCLEEVVHLVRDKAALLGQGLGLAPYDALVDELSPGMTTADIDAVFKGLARRLPGLIREVLDLQADRPVLPIGGVFPRAKQRQLAHEIMKTIGFPFERGRLDEGEQPFTGGMPGDVRVVTRFDTADFLTGLLGTLHETGRAVYYLGLPQTWQEQPVGCDRGLALQESQSELLGMIVGRSRAFLRYLQPLLERHLGVRGAEWEVENLYALLTRVQRSPVRVRADELTSPLHMLLRYELEQQLLAGELAARDLPDAWNAALEARLEIRPANDVEGCLQDAHWASGSFGCFPSCVLGTVIAAQLFESLRAGVQGVHEQIARGEFAGLNGWLRQHVHGFGAKAAIHELIRQVTGKPPGAAAFLRYLEGKYLEDSDAATEAA
ncbi:MAG: carboxypeptidase M32 [Gammaproteobacteria bacterium]|nr:carboxypeptidase M32 [Gammaproteobacteria bacterium]